MTDFPIARILTAVAITAFVFIALTLPMPAFAGEQVRFYTPDGRSAGTAAPQSDGSARYYDARGRSLGTSTTTPSGATTVYNSQGRVIGRTQSYGAARSTVPQGERP
jgi:YD repeat-containing protein